LKVSKVSKVSKELTNILFHPKIHYGINLNRNNNIKRKENNKK